MTTEVSPEAVASRIAQAIAQGRGIEYGSEMPDKEYPGISWSIFGLPETNEIAVTVRAGNLRLGMIAPSTLIHPAMVDRIFGIDVSDQQLAHSLSDQLWAAHSALLIAQAHGSRSS